MVKPNFTTLLLLMTALLHAQSQPQPPEAFDISFEEIARERHYGQALRPQFHYTPIQGHIGDATGLVYYAGEYHLFYMFDEWSRRRLAHKRWGHAISTDLIHWREMPPVLDTLIDNKPGSGSAVVDWNDSSGLRDGAEKTLILFYTDYKRGTCILYSRDRGRNWVRHERNPVIAGAEDARDPTVFWYRAAGEWRMVRYEKKGFAFYKSRNLLDWTWLSRVEGFYECPDLLELPVLNTNERRWVLIDGDGSYVIGVFDGQQFTPQTQKLRVEYGRALYATQTWKRTLEGGPPAYQLAFLRYPMTPRLTWINQMSFPVELTLWSFPEGIRLCRQPIDEVNNLRVSQQSWRDLVAGPGEKPLPEADGDLLDLRAEIEPAGASDFGLILRGQEVRYSVTNGTIHLGAASAPLKLADKTLRLRILVDRPSIEVFADRGQVTLSAVNLTTDRGKSMKLFAEGGKIRVVSLDVNRLESIWRKPE
jgi:sucrose-6-phosphate hydrolase SacC (GH32 family)